MKKLLAFFLYSSIALKSIGSEDPSLKPMNECMRSQNPTCCAVDLIKKSINPGNIIVKKMPNKESMAYKLLYVWTEDLDKQVKHAYEIFGCSRERTISPLLEEFVAVSV